MCIYFVFARDEVKNMNVHKMTTTETTSHKKCEALPNIISTTISLFSLFVRVIAMESTHATTGMDILCRSF